MRSHAVVQHDDGTPTGSRSTSFFIRGILGPDALSIFMRWLRRRPDRSSVAASLVGHPGEGLEIPAWMFDRAARAAWRVGAAPYVEIAVLTALATLLQVVTSVSDAPSQHHFAQYSTKRWCHFDTGLWEQREGFATRSRGCADLRIASSGRSGHGGRLGRMRAKIDDLFLERERLKSPDAALWGRSQAR